MTAHPSSQPAPGPIGPSSWSGRPDAAVVVSDPASLIASVPSLVGFYPVGSLVVVVVAALSWRAREGIRLTMRVDLPPADVLVADVRAMCRALLVPVLRLRPARVYLLAYPEPAPEHRPEPHPLTAALVGAYRAAGIPVGDSIVVGRHAWWSEVCCDPGCCPPEGRPLDTSAALGARAELVFGGNAPFATRDDVVARVAPAAEAEVAAVLEALRGRAGEGGALGDVLRVLRAPTGAVLRPARAAAALAALGSVPVRDEAVAALLSRDAALAVGRGCRLVALAPAGWVAPVATCVAALAYVAGQGALTWACLDRAFDDDPGYSLALLLSEAVRCGLPPDDLVEAFRAGGGLSEQ